MKLENNVHPESAEPTRSTPAGTETPADPSMKKCPDCAEDVRTEARKCRFCGFVFPDQYAAETKHQQPVQPVATGTPWGVVALITLAMAVLVIVFIAANPSGPSGSKYDPPAVGTSEKQQESSGFGPGKIDNTVSTGRIKNTISIDTNGCPTLEGFEQDIIHPGTVPGCINLDRGDKVIGPLEVQVVRAGNSDFKYARIEVPGKGELWTSYVHLTK